MEKGSFSRWFVMSGARSRRCSTVIGVWIALLFVLSGVAWAERSTAGTLEERELLEVKVHLLGFDSMNKQPLVFLSDPLEQRALPICIGLFEANAIYSEMQGITHRRPLTHDLLERIINTSRGKIHRVIITHHKEGIYYARIEMDRGGSLIKIDARPSDSIVMALKFKSPIYVTKTLFKEMAIPIGERKDLDELYGLTLQELTETLAEYFSFGSTRGVLVSGVRKGSLAESDGIKRGDIFVEVGGKSVDNVTSLKEVIITSTSAVQAKIFRKAQFLSITLHPE
jgi:bifunctional DNase/RNase